MSNNFNDFEDFLEELRDENLIEKPRVTSVVNEEKASVESSSNVVIAESQLLTSAEEPIVEAVVIESAEMPSEIEPTVSNTAAAVGVLDSRDEVVEPKSQDISNEELTALFAEAEELDKLSNAANQEQSAPLAELAEIDQEVSGADVPSLSKEFATVGLNSGESPEPNVDAHEGGENNGSTGENVGDSESEVKSIEATPDPDEVENISSIDTEKDADAKTLNETPNIGASQAGNVGSADEKSLTAVADDEELAVESATDYALIRRRAAEEISTLKMVEHLISGIEREQLKTVSKPFDAYGVDLALHDLLQLTKGTDGDVERTLIAEAEFKFSDATQFWYRALTQRDEKISVGHLRRYCETTKPALSSDALIALARFYKNSSHSESIRGKFDMTLTRLFSRDEGDDTRKLVVSQHDVAKLLDELYEDWASVAMFEYDAAKVKECVSKFNEFVTEVEKAKTFEEIVASDLFQRVRTFKESCGETFYAPEVVAAAVNSNVAIGNKYIALIELEREIKRENELEAKYRSLLDHAISEATSKSLNLSELLNQTARPVEQQAAKPQRAERPATKARRASRIDAPKNTAQRKTLFGISRTLAIAAILTLIFGVGSFVYFQSTDTEIGKSSDVKNVDLSNSSLKQYLKTAKITGKSFVAIVEPAWTSLSDDEKKEILKKIHTAGATKGYLEVILLDNNGTSVGFASKSTVTTSADIKID